MSENAKPNTSDFLASLTEFTREHRARHWQGTFREFLETAVADRADLLARTSHQYIWDMLRWYGEKYGEEGDKPHRHLFANDLFGVDRALERITDYFKAASAGWCRAVALVPS